MIPSGELVFWSGFCSGCVGVLSDLSNSSFAFFRQKKLVKCLLRKGGGFARKVGKQPGFGGLRLRASLDSHLLS